MSSSKHAPRHQHGRRRGQSQPPGRIERRSHSHLKADGRPKISFLSEESASLAAEALGGGEVYRCDEYGCLHVGHSLPVR